MAPSFSSRFEFSRSRAINERPTAPIPSRLTIRARLEFGVVLFVDGHRKIHVRAVRPALEERPGRERVGAVGRTTVDPDEASEIAQPLAARERPECFFAEKQID